MTYKLPSVFIAIPSTVGPDIQASRTIWLHTLLRLVATFFGLHAGLPHAQRLPTYSSVPRCFWLLDYTVGFCVCVLRTLVSRHLPTCLRFIVHACTPAFYLSTCPTHLSRLCVYLLLSLPTAPRTLPLPTTPATCLYHRRRAFRVYLWLPSRTSLVTCLTLPICNAIPYLWRRLAYHPHAAPVLLFYLLTLFYRALPLDTARTMFLPHHPPA